MTRNPSSPKSSRKSRCIFLRVSKSGYSTTMIRICCELRNSVVFLTICIQYRMIIVGVAASSRNSGSIPSIHFSVDPTASEHEMQETSNNQNMAVKVIFWVSTGTNGLFIAYPPFHNAYFFTYLCNMKIKLSFSPSNAPRRAS